jgi:hypothetical protein
MNPKQNPLDDLLNRISRGERPGKEELGRVTDLSARAIPVIAEKVRRADSRSGKALADIIRHIHESAAVPYLIDLLNDQNATLSLTAYYSLGSLRDSTAVAPLLEILDSLPSHGFPKTLSVRTLGEIGDDSVKSRLRDVAVEFGAIESLEKGGSIREWIESLVDEDEVRFVLELAVAMSKLGDDELLPIVLAIADFTTTNYESIDPLRPDAVAALRYFICPGVFSMLSRALKGDDPAVAQAAIVPLQYLGHPRSVEELLDVADENSVISDEAIHAVYAITGNWLTEDVSGELGRQALEDWWRFRKETYLRGTCYRLGSPISVLKLVSLLRDAKEPSDLGDELRTISGEDLAWLSDSQLDEWLQHKVMSFETGRLYRYGRLKDPEIVFAEH